MKERQGQFDDTQFRVLPKFLMQVKDPNASEVVKNNNEFEGLAKLSDDDGRCVHLAKKEVDRIESGVATAERRAEAEERRAAAAEREVDELKDMLKCQVEREERKAAEAKREVDELNDMLKCPVCYERAPDRMLLLVRCGHRLCEDCYRNVRRPVTYEKGWKKTQPIECHICRMVVKKATRKDGIVRIRY